MSTTNIATSDANIFIIDPIEEFFTARLTTTFNYGSMAQDTPHQIPVDGAINTPSDPVQILADGTIIFNEVGLFLIEREFLPGKTSFLNQSYTYTYDEVDGIFPSYADITCYLNDDDQYFRQAKLIFVDVQSTPYTYKFFIWSGSQGSADGTLESLIVTAPATVSGPTASFQVTLKRINRVN